MCVHYFEWKLFSVYIYWGVLRKYETRLDKDYLDSFKSDSSLKQTNKTHTHTQAKIKSSNTQTQSTKTKPKLKQQSKQITNT